MILSRQKQEDKCPKGNKSKSHAPWVYKTIFLEKWIIQKNFQIKYIVDQKVAILWNKGNLLSLATHNQYHLKTDYTNLEMKL